MDTPGRCASLVACAFAVLPLLAPVVGQEPVRVPHPTATRLAGRKSADDSARMIVDYGRALRIDFDATEGAGDEQRLLVGDCDSAPCTVGPLAKIQPRYRRPNWETPPRDSGEIIARIISDGPYMRITGTDTVFKFNIHGQDTVFWWVGPRGEQRQLVSVFTTTHPGVAPLVSNLEVGAHKSDFWKQGLARWIYSPRDEKGWGTCDGGRCCSSNGLQLP